MISLTNDFLHNFKNITEQNWKETKINTRIYGFQFQTGTKWNIGLNDQKIKEYENHLKIEFPEELKMLLHVINGTNLPTINVYGNSGEQYKYSVGVYSYPRDIKEILDRIERVIKHSEYWDFDIIENDYLLPFYSHRYIQIRNNEVLRVVSIYDEDGIEYGSTLLEYLEKEFQLTIAST